MLDYTEQQRKEVIADLAKKIIASKLVNAVMESSIVFESVGIKFEDGVEIMIKALTEQAVSVRAGKEIILAGRKK